MMVTGAVKVLLGFQLVTTVLNLVFNVLLVKPLGLAGGCLVIILTKLVMAVLTFLYCQIRFRLFKIWDFVFPIALGAVCYCLFLVLVPLIGAMIQHIEAGIGFNCMVTEIHPSVAITLAVYSVILWKLGPKFLGGIPRKNKV
jgi:peptidoglycan biosynthesis protein MviN/MurJ (putative lipid II flippase)